MQCDILETNAQRLQYIGPSLVSGKSGMLSGLGHLDNFSYGAKNATSKVRRQGDFAILTQHFNFVHTAIF